VIFDEIVVHNFGVYGGRHSLNLTPPSKSKPVVLIGGLNGGGKTTLLDAIHLSLYGKRARCSNRGGLGYDDYLRKCIHHKVSPEEGAAVEVQFRQRTEGLENKWRVHRSWRASAGGISEKVEVIRNGTFDRVLTDIWGELAEEFIPVEISSLFFFDGEKIEGFADPDISTQLLSKAIHSLLGLDLVDRLSTDLIALERRKQPAPKNSIDQEKIEKAGAEVKRLEQLRSELLAKRGELQNNLERRKYDLRKIEDRFQREGGDLFERRNQLEAEREVVSRQLLAVENELRELAEGAAPLLLVRELLQAVDRQSIKEKESARAEAVRQILTIRDSWLISELQTLRASEKLVGNLKSRLKADRKHLASKATRERYLNLSIEAQENLLSLHRMVLPDIQRRTARLIQRCEEMRSALEDLERQLAGVPDQNAIASLIDERQKVKSSVEEALAQLGVLDIQIAHVSRELEQNRTTVATLAEKSIEAEFEQEDTVRIIRHSQKVRKTLQIFRTAAIERHVNRIAQLVLDSFRQLLRKQTLISTLRIDPLSFTIEMRGPDGNVLSPDRLSAGERQLLAVSLLWGLARASGRPLPAVIDTPLGRLDASHRYKLIERYFPYASHQVLLLSTDEEIDEHYFEKLKPWVGHAYHLEFDDTEGSTEVKPGYFW
jgi:DNA sulfur modification protein DndD